VRTCRVATVIVRLHVEKAITSLMIAVELRMAARSHNGVGYLDNVVQDIYVIPVEGGEPKRLTKDDCHNSKPVWSPNGQDILLSAAMCPDSHRVYPVLKVVNLDGEVRELVGDWGYANSAAWTPDGKQILFIGNPLGLPDGSNENLWMIAGQGGEPQCCTASLTFQVGGEVDGDMPIGSLMFPRILMTVVEMLRFPNSPHEGSIEGAPIVRRAQNEALLDWMNRYVLSIEPDQEEEQESN